MEEEQEDVRVAPEQRGGALVWKWPEHAHRAHPLLVDHIRSTFVSVQSHTHYWQARLYKAPHLMLIILSEVRFL